MESAKIDTFTPALFKAKFGGGFGSRHLDFPLMTPEQFYHLDEMEQAEVIWDGKYIADRQDKEHHILLYKVDDLFVEVYYHKKHNILVKFHAFSEHKLLDIYLPKN